MSQFAEFLINGVALRLADLDEELAFDSIRFDFERAGCGRPWAKGVTNLARAHVNPEFSERENIVSMLCEGGELTWQVQR